MAKAFWNKWQAELRMGLLVVGVTLLWMVGENILVSVYERPEWGNITGTLAILIPLIGFWLMLSHAAHRDKALEWGRALRSGAVMTLTIAIVGAIVVYLYVWLVPQPIELYLEYLREQYEAQGLAAEQIEVALEATASYFVPHVQALATVVGSIFTGFILTIAITPIQRFRLKRRKPQPPVV